MSQGEARYRVTAALLQAAQPLTLSRLAEQSGVGGDELAAALEQLQAEHLVVGGQLDDGGGERLYGWAERWARR